MKRSGYIALIVIFAMMLAIPIGVRLASEQILRHAVLHGSTSEVSFCLMFGVKIDDPVDSGDGNRTPLHLAARLGDERMVKYLLAHGADINAAWSDGVTVLEEAEEGGNKQIIEIIHRRLGTVYDFCEVGDVNKVQDMLRANPSLLNSRQEFNYDKEPLHIAAQYGQVKVVQLLLSAGADVKARDGNNDTPLHLAATREVAQVLLDHGADVNARHGSHWTPLKAARDAGLTDVAQLLETRGGHEK
jgi:ankyrin repeat protein